MSAAGGCRPEPAAADFDAVRAQAQTDADRHDHLARETWVRDYHAQQRKAYLAEHPRPIGDLITVLANCETAAVNALQEAL